MTAVMRKNLHEYFFNVPSLCVAYADIVMVCRAMSSWPGRLPTLPIFTLRPGCLVRAHQSPDTCRFAHLGAFQV